MSLVKSSTKIPIPKVAAAKMRRAALYLRVSTGRQAEGDVSLPSQRRLTRGHCEREGWIVTDEYVEPGVSATDDRRPAFQALMDRACDADRPYDLIVVHAFSRFYRNGAEMELAIRKLRRHGVEVVSITQPTGTDPSAEMMRQIIGIFDEYTSKENGKQVTRAMRENASQGFWNGATPPLGYNAVEAERRGAKIKKRLAIDEVEAETVRLIFRLYLEGDSATGTPPLGIKEVVKWLNSRGFVTKRGGTFGVGAMHHILTNTAYVGRWHYNVRNKATGERRSDEEIVTIDVPRILEDATFEAVQVKLVANNPRVSPVRIASGPILLTGLATCAHCGGGMTQRTGTSRSGKVYAYYTCASRAQRGPTVCRGNSIPMAHLDDLVLTALQERLFAPERLAEVLSALVARRAARAEAVDARLVALQTEVATAEDKLRRLYKLVEDGMADLDDILRDRIAILKGERERAQAAFERARAQSGGHAAIDPEKVAAFGKLMREVLSSTDTPARKAYLRAILGAVEVDTATVRITGSRDVLHAAIADAPAARDVVQFTGPKWRARKDSNL
ncbi:recombinase family protein [Aureimonas sp. SK2]|uniref:recombinase family protein n=1 Tax=Aureimonas sp. SK2 TaxID=3015992 RepID=UPI0024449A12|nr:recombinase family protein [Aureimonas sp. SK2]